MDILNFLIQPVLTVYNESGLIVTLLAGYGAICLTRPVAKWLCSNDICYEDHSHRPTTGQAKASKMLVNQTFDFKSNVKPHELECELELTKTFKNK